MAKFFIGRNPGPPDVANFHTAEYIYDTDTDTVSFFDFFIVKEESFPPIGKVLYSMCDGTTLKQYVYNGGNTQATIDINIVTTPNSPSCCSINAADFTLEINADNGSDNGSIVITSSVVDVDLYEASLDGGSYSPGSSGEIEFTGLEFGEHVVRIRLIDGACFVDLNIIIPFIDLENPFTISLTSPSQFSPVFYPIQYTGEFNGNEVDIEQSGPYTVIVANDSGLQNYLATLPLIRIYDSENYAGVFTVLQRLNTTSFVIQAEYAIDETVRICPSGKQIFLLYCERGFNEFIKIAEIGSAADPDGQFNIRVEGFLQSEFILNPPVLGDEITLGRKFYLIAQDYAITTDISTAVYSAVPSLTEFLEDLTPIGPAPMNFVSEQTQKGLPVLFSFLNQTTGRVVNIISSNETDIISTNDVTLNALPCNQYDIEWIKVAGNINGSVTSDPALPSWIQLETDTDRLYLTINACGDQGIGDYEPDDYLSEDYLTSNFNDIVGCYEYELSDGDGVLFTLNICVYPIQQPAALVCPDNAYNIAWINRQGGWSSYTFASDRGDRSKKTSGYEVDSTTDYKRETELKKSSVEGLYETGTVLFSNKNQRELIFISSLRTSIQAYLWNESTLAWDIPIFIDVDSFPTYSVPFNQAVDGNGSFTFRYSNEVKIQRQ